MKQQTFLLSIICWFGTFAFGQAATINISPAAVKVAPGGTIQFTVTRTGRSPGDVSWSVNDIRDGNAGFGTITEDGLYTAPTAISTIAIVVKAEWGALQAAANIQLDDNSLSIVRADQASARLFSFLAIPDKPTHFIAKSPAGDNIPADWAVTPGPGDPGNIGTISPDGTYTITKDQAAHAAHTIVLTSTPAPGSGYAAGRLNIVVAPDILIKCWRSDIKPSPNCDVKEFDRLTEPSGVMRAHPKAPLETITRNIASAINSSKAMASGGVIIANLTGVTNPLNCTNYDWKIAVQSEESAGIIIYNPADAEPGICDPDTGQFIVALPVHVLWADVFGYHQNLDPARPTPAAPSDYKDCAGKPAPSTIVPCDKNGSRILTHLYKMAPFFSRFSPPGNGQGSINFSGKGEISFDIQADPAYKIGPGWFNVPIVLERGATGANLNSLTFAAAYDLRWLRKPNLSDLGTGFRFIIRKPQVQVRSGIEASPSHPATGMAPTQSHDWNYIWGETVRFPVVVNFHDQPSSFTFYPVIGSEQGWHLANNLPINDSIVRSVAGADGSFRWPLNTTHNFLGSTPIGFEVQYRIRGLLNQEPLADFADLPPSNTTLPCSNKSGIISSPSGKGCIASEFLSSRSRSFFKADTTVPLDPYIQFKVSVSRGSLPPDFWNIGWSYTLGLSFGNPSSSEH